MLDAEICLSYKSISETAVPTLPFAANFFIDSRFMSDFWIADSLFYSKAESYFNWMYALVSFSFIYLNFAYFSSSVSSAFSDFGDNDILRDVADFSILLTG